MFACPDDFAPYVPVPYPLLVVFFFFFLGVGRPLLESSNIRRVVSVLSSLRKLTQHGCNVSSCIRVENNFFCQFLIRVRGDRWSWQSRSSSSGRTASNAAILMSPASVCRWPFRASRLCVCRIIKSSYRSTDPCNSPNLARPGERISLSSPLALSRRQGVPALVQTRPTLLMIQSPQGC